MASSPDTSPLSVTSSREHRTTAQPAAADLARVTTATDRALLSFLHRYLEEVPVALVFGDLARAPARGEAVGTIRVRDRATLIRLLKHPSLAFGEAFMNGDVEVTGDLVAVLEALYATRSSAPRGWRHRLALAWDRSHGLRAARHNIHHHYDLGNDFYRLWLDRELVYTCAYFPDERASLEEAQVAKMEYVCRKLRLQPGERVVEAGCGWGALALHMARAYGVQVRAFNISREQIAYARARARAEGLASRVEFVEDDYRHVGGRYDAFVSVGMLEHVGLECYETLGRVIDRVLDANGRGFLHFIGRNYPAPLNAWIRKRIFPGGYPPTLAQVVERILSPFDFSVVDVENLRLHYARTLHHWRTRFETAADRVRSMFDERFVRAWRLYLAGSEAAFTTGAMQLFQVLFARGAQAQLPLTRDDLYRRLL